MPFRWWPPTLLGLRGIEAYEVLQAVTAERRWPRARTAAGLPVLTVWARTRAGRPLIVVTAQLARFDQLIIGARDMTATELAEFQAWEATR